MLIWGWTTRFKKMSEGVFVCPFEGSQQAYALLAGRRWFTIFWFPLIPLRRVDSIVRCESCGRGFGDGILEMATSVTGPNPQAGVDIPVPRRFTPGMIVLPLLVLVIGGFAWGSRGTTGASFLKAGDCFQMTDTAEIDRLETPDCGDPHDSQIVAVVELPLSGAYPPDGDAYWRSVYEVCTQQADVNLMRWEELPEETVLDFFSPTAEGWAAGDRRSLCFISSSTGLDGSFVR